MEHIAIDLGSRTSQICVRDAKGQIVEERACMTRCLGAYLRRRPASQVIVEASSEAFGVARLAQAAGHQISIVPSVLSRALGRIVSMREMPGADTSDAADMLTAMLTSRRHTTTTHQWHRLPAHTAARRNATRITARPGRIHNT